MCGDTESYMNIFCILFGLFFLNNCDFNVLIFIFVPCSKACALHFMYEL